MDNQIEELHRSVTTLVRRLKIAETSLRVAHGELKFQPADIQSMRFIADQPGCKLAELAAHLGVVPTTASSVVDRLVRRGLVDRVRPEANRRAVALSLSGAGRDAFERLEAEELAAMRIMLDALGEGERAGFVAAMKRIATAID